MGFAGDADLAVKPSDVAVGRGGIGLTGVGIPISPLRLSFQEQLIEDVLDVSRADVLQGINLRRKILVRDGFVQRLDHFLDLFHSSGRGLDYDSIPAAVSHHVHLFGLFRLVLEGIEVEWIAWGCVLFLIEVLQLFGHVAGLGVFERESAHDTFLGLLGVQHGDDALNGFEIGFARKNDQRVGAFVG